MVDGTGRTVPQTKHVKKEQLKETILMLLVFFQRNSLYFVF